MPLPHAPLVDPIKMSAAEAPKEKRTRKPFFNSLKHPDAFEGAREKTPELLECYTTLYTVHSTNLDKARTNQRQRSHERRMAKGEANPGEVHVERRGRPRKNGSPSDSPSSA